LAAINEAEVELNFGKMLFRFHCHCNVFTFEMLTYWETLA